MCVLFIPLSVLKLLQLQPEPSSSLIPSRSVDNVRYIRAQLAFSWLRRHGQSGFKGQRQGSMYLDLD